MVEQEYWQNLSYLPGKTQAMPKAWGKSLRRLNRTTRSDPSLLITKCTTVKALLQRERGWVRQYKLKIGRAKAAKTIASDNVLLLL